MTTPSWRTPTTVLICGGLILTLAMGITRIQNGADVTRGALVVRAAAEVGRFEIAVTPRIGITQCAGRPLRFLIRGSRFVSRA